jgi:wobble nucleotide-excising tRNase
VISGENGKGKTTFAAVLRSLEHGDPSPVLERRRGLNGGGYEDFLVKVVHDAGIAVLSHNQGVWVGQTPTVFVFDDAFIRRNVYEGVSVGPDQREALHTLVVGEAAVAEAQKVEDLSTELASLRKDQKELKARLAASLNTLGVDRACSETPPVDIPSAIAATEAELERAKQVAPIQALPEFGPLPGLPDIPISATMDVLGLTVQQLEASAQERVLARFRTLGAGGEAWVQQGVRLVEQTIDCPFCGQEIGDAARALIETYRLHYSHEYETLQGRCTKLIKQVESSLPEHLPSTFAAAHESLRGSWRQWSVHLDSLPMLPDLPDMSCMAALKTGITKALAGKRANPNLVVTFDADTEAAIERWAAIRAALEPLRSVVQELRQRSADFRLKCAALDRDKLERRLAELLDWQRVCDEGETRSPLLDYKAGETKIVETLSRLESAKEALQVYQDSRFPKFQARINAHLCAFGASFTLDSVSRSRASRGGERRVDFELCAASTKVKVGVSQQVGAPHFGSLLSAGDRRTLGLAVFLSYLEDKNLSGSTVVCDDPTTSLDQDRRSQTVVELLKLAERGAQVVVLSHFEPFLLDVEDRASRLKAKDPGINFTSHRVDGAPHKSVLVSHQFDRRSRLVRLRDEIQIFVDGATLDPAGICNQCRKVLEGCLQLCYPDALLPGECLKEFCGRVQPLLDRGRLSQQKFNEIKELRDFFNPESHFGEGTPSTATEVRNHAKRLLKLATVQLGELGN